MDTRDNYNHLNALVRNYYGPSASCVPAEKVLVLIHHDKIALLILFIT